MIQSVSGDDGITFEQFARFMQEEDENEAANYIKEDKKKKTPKKKDSDSKSKTPKTTLTRKRSKSTITTSSKIMNLFSPRSKKTEKTEKTEKSEKSTDKKTRKRSNSSNGGESHERSIEEMHRAFQAFDLNGDGKVTTHEVGIMMRRFGLGSQEQSIQNLFDLLGPSEQGKKTEEIDFAQFLKLTNMV